MTTTSNLYVEVFLVCHCNANCSINVTIHSINEKDLTATVEASLEAADGAEWTFASLPNGWILYAHLPGSDDLGNGQTLTLSAPGRLSVELSIPSKNDCVSQAATPVIALTPAVTPPAGAAFGP